MRLESVHLARSELAQALAGSAIVYAMPRVDFDARLGSTPALPREVAESVDGSLTA
jgi:hypothetical protein